MQLLLGLDVGTSAVKCLAFNLRGEIVASARSALQLSTPRAGWVEQDPEQIWSAVAEACRAVTSRLPRMHKIVALSLSAQGGTTIPQAADGTPTHMAFSWMDERADTESAVAAATLGADALYRTTGWPLSPGLPLNHIAWFRTHQETDFKRTRRFCFVNDFVTSRLCGAYGMDPSNASITQLYNLAAGTWDAQLLELAGVEPEQLSPIGESGQVSGQITAWASQQTGLPIGLPVVLGAHDQYCAAVGTGTTQIGQALLSCGTAWVILTIPHGQAGALEAGMSVSRHAIPGHFGGIVSLGGVGAIVDWLVSLLWPHVTGSAARYQALNQAVLGAPPGSHGVLFRPHPRGRAVGNETLDLSFSSVALRHTRGDLSRAMMEGVAFELRRMLSEVDEAADVTAFKMIGGGSRSQIWPHIVADITGRPIELVSISESASLGAAVLAGVGAGLFNTCQAGAASLASRSQPVRPDPNLAEVYDGQYARYCEASGPDACPAADAAGGDGR